MTTLDRESWARRWAADPTLRPEGLEWFVPAIRGQGMIECHWQVRRAHVPLAAMIDESVATALIVARAVEWLVEHGWTVELDEDGETTNFSVRLSKRHLSIAPTLLDALGAAVDLVLAGREVRT